MASSYVMNSHFAIYLRGNLVTAAGGVPPSCRPLPTCTPSGPGAMALRSGNDGNESTPTTTPTPVVDQGLVDSVAVGPNISNGQGPIRFFLRLNKSAQVTLALVTLTGEQIYSQKAQGNQGLNNIVWDAKNNLGQTAASGLYLYYLQVNDGKDQETCHGKIVIIH